MNWDKEILNKIDFDNIKNKEEKEKVDESVKSSNADNCNSYFL